MKPTEAPWVRLPDYACFFGGLIIALKRVGNTTPMRTIRELPTDFDHSSRKDIYNLRTRRVEERPELLKNGYRPSSPIYSLIKDNLLWWGIDGYYSHLRSPHRAGLSASGKSLRGMEIVNPFYLATVRFHTLSVENPEFKWRAGRARGPEASTCPYWPEHTEVAWMPGERKAEITYYVTNYRNQLEKDGCLEKPLAESPIKLTIDPVNAQDLGLLYMSFSTKDSVNVSFDEVNLRPKRLNFFYHQGTSCGHPDGCNNISPFVEDFHDVMLTSLPAALVMKYWAEEPANRESDADFQYIVHFE